MEEIKLNVYDDKNIDKYEYSIENINYLFYRSTFNSYLKKFIDYCNSYNIKYYDLFNNNYHILKKKYVVKQIRKIIKKYIYNHINILSNVILTDISKYVDENHKISTINENKLRKLNEFIDLVNIVYEYKLLHIEPLNKPDIDIHTEYTHLVNLSNLVTKQDNNVIIIDSYSW